MKTINIFFTLISVFLFFGSQAQTKNVDTIGLESRADLLQELNAAKQDTERAMLLSALGDGYIQSKPDTALLLVNQGLALSDKTNFPRGKAYSFFLLARIHESTGNYPKALELFFKSLEINDSLKAAPWIAANLLFIGEIYGLEEDYTQSLAYSYKAKTLADSVNYYIISAWALLYIGNACEKTDRIDSALLCTQQSLALTKQKKVPRINGKTFCTLGNIYLKKDSLATAMQYYRKSLPILDSLDDKATICQSWLGLAKIYEKTGEPDSAAYYGKRSLTTAQKGGFLFQVYDAAAFLSAFYKSQNNIDSAYFYKEISFAVKDSLFSQQKIIAFQNIVFTRQLEEQKLLEAQNQYRNKIRMYVLIAGLAVLLLLAAILLKNNRQKQRANLLLSKQKKEIDFQKDEIEKSFHELKSAQAQLIQSEKMASLGELTAGIAHEIQNPLNFVNNFSELNNELIEELKSQKSTLKSEEQDELLNDIAQNNEKIAFHGNRADAIVKGMLQHSRTSTGQRELTDINKLADEYVRLSFHGLRAKDKSFNADFKTDFDERIGKINIVPQDIGRVILNLINNAFYTVNEKRKLSTNGYKPLVTVITKKINNKIEIIVKDNGNGIPQNVINKIFQPFFTTKPTGQGTGLGLSLSYDIITKEHNGTIRVESKEGEGSEFIIQLPA